MSQEGRRQVSCALGLRDVTGISMATQCACSWSRDWEGYMCPLRTIGPKSQLLDPLPQFLVPQVLLPACSTGHV